MEMERPSPDDILREMKAEEIKQSSGRLKIFFGYAAGVGKTYAMLKAARSRKEEGIDVVCGYIEPHARPETMRQLAGLERIPVREISYNGITLQEMDLDAVLERRPRLALVDELAHTNAPGSRHSKRYQDVEELLHAGIDVYTTVNVQHIESLCDIVASITGILVRERIPDGIFDMAWEVQLVDVEPPELLERLEQGKIYRETQARRALDNFFTEEKLTALREIALRRTADRVNLMSEKARKRCGSEYFTEEKIIVGLSSSPSNPKIIRAAARMAQAFRGELTGIYVETSGGRRMPPEDQRRLKDHIRLAEQLGAKIETIVGEDIAFLMAEYARCSGVSKIVIGRSNTKRSLLSRPSFADRLIAMAPNVDIYMIPDSEAVKKRASWDRNQGGLPGRREITASLGILAVATLTGFLFQYFGFSEANIITVYIFGVMLSGVVTSDRLCSLGLSVMSVLVFNYCFTEPKLSLKTYHTGYPITFFIMFLAAFLSSSLALKLKRQAGDMARASYRTKVLLDMNQQLQSERSIMGIGKLASAQLAKLLTRDIIFYNGEGGALARPVILHGREGGEETGYLSESERAVAEWVYKNNKRAGAATDTLGSAACHYLAVRGSDQVYGVIGIGLAPGELLDSFENNLIFSVLTETAAAMERETLRKKEEQAREQAGMEQLRANLLRSISHDLRTPLTSIMGNADMLMKSRLEEATKKIMYKDIYEESMWLIALVENLLSVTGMENGTMKLRRQAEMLEDILQEALSRSCRRSGGHKITVSMEDEMQMVRVDSGLIIQVILNLLENAVKYTPAGSEIHISTRRFGKMVQISVADNGDGIPDNCKPYIFDMFYTVGEKLADSRRSMGIGLALCRAVVQAHGGVIRVMDNYPRGAVFRFTVEAQEVTIHE